MADGIIKRFVTAVWDGVAAKKVERQFEDSLAKAGREGGKGFLKEIRAAFDKRMADLKVQLAKGVIDPKEFKKQAALAAKAFNDALLKNMDAAKKAGTLTDKEFVKLSRTLKKVGDDGAKAGDKVGSAFLKAGAGLAAFFTLDKALRFFSSSISEAIAAERSVSRLDSVLRPLGITFAEVNKEAEQYFSTIQKTTRFTDDDARDAFANLITATGDYRLSLSLLDVTAKIAEKRQTTMAEAAQTAADASKGLTRGMKDLGISAKETGDIVAKINTNLGDLARDGLKTTSGQIQNANNLWNEFKEQVGAAIIGSDNLQGSLGAEGLRGALIDLNEWTEKNSKSITTLTNDIVSLGRFSLKTTAALIDFFSPGGPFRLGERIANQITGRRPALTPTTPGTGNFLRFGGGPRRTAAPTEEEIEREKRLIKERAAALEKAETELAVIRIQLEKGITEQQAQEQLTQERLRTGHVARETATIAQLEAAWLALGRARFDAARSLAFAGVQTARLSGVEKDTTPPPIAGVARDAAGKLLPQSRPLEFVDRGLPLKSIDQQPQVDTFFDPWFEAMHLLREEVEGAGTLFAELGQAWAEGGLAGFAKMAMHKVKENIARAIEEAAKAFGSFALGNPGAAAAHAKAAAGHTAAAAAWRVVGGAAGGGGGGGGGGASGGVNENRAPNLRGGNVQPVGTEVHLYLSDRIGALVDDVEFQRASLAAMEKARERWGDSARIYVHRGSK